MNDDKKRITLKGNAWHENRFKDLEPILNESEYHKIDYREKLIQEIKEKTFETLYKYYNQLQVCANTLSDKEREILQDNYNDIIWRLQDFESASFDIDLDLNFDDYEQLSNTN